MPLLLELNQDPHNKSSITSKDISTEIIHLERENLQVFISLKYLPMVVYTLYIETGANSRHCSCWQSIIISSIIPLNLRSHQCSSSSLATGSYNLFTTRLGGWSVSIWKKTPCKDQSQKQSWKGKKCNLLLFSFSLMSSELFNFSALQSFVWHYPCPVYGYG